VPAGPRASASRAAGPAPIPAAVAMSSLEPLLQLLPLERLPRTGWVLAGIPVPESVAAHSLSTAFVALALAPRVSPVLDVDRAVALAVVHDVAEALTGDLPPAATSRLPRGAKDALEAECARVLLEPLSGPALERHLEGRASETREARFARVCDGLQLGVRLVGYVRSGARGLGEFRARIEALDCAEFAPCEALRREILAALDEVR
jgi:putative hydrolase of HD superfamily